MTPPRAPKMVKPAKVDVADLYNAGREAPVLESVDGANDSSVKPELSWRSRITPVESTWCTEYPPARRWLLRDARRLNNDGFLPRGKTGQLIAAGGVGKTMGLVQLMVAIATGEPWLDTFSVEQPGRVFGLLAEEEVEEARRRIFEATRGSKTPPANSIVLAPLHGVPCALLDRDGDGRSVETAFADDLRRFLAENGPWDLLVFEPISRLGGPDCEIDNAVATRFVQVIESFADLTGATALTAHHTNKQGRLGGVVVGNASRGASALHDGFRWQASLGLDDVEGGEIITFTVTKSNYSRKSDPLLLRRVDGGRLVPLTPEEQAQAVAAVTGELARKQRAAQREQERAAAGTRREEREATERADRERSKTETARAKQMSEEHALTAVLQERPGICTDALRAALAARIGGCTRERMRDILARLGAKVVAYTPDGGARNAIAYRLEAQS